jgi:murein tripeptide amidase MpaA
VSNSRAAVELRKRYIFKVVPMINVDGVIVGNYRTSLSGNDLNRRYLEPNRKLHPEIYAIKTLMGDLVAGKYKCNWGSA